ncbi:MAG: two-component system response regulator DesR [Alteromonadaceae bacterium]|jgi:two-component system response regulator DesR
MINVMVVEDQAMVRGAICALLNLHAQITVIAEAEDGKKALSLLKNNDLEKIDILLTDIEMPHLSGIELAEEVLKKYKDIRLVIMTTFSRSGYIKRAINAGVKGFILKEAPSDDLIDAIIKVHQGRTVIDPELAINALGEIDLLTNKERKALRFAGDGLTTSEIAKKLFLSEGTVRNYLSEAIAKLNATNRIDAARLAKQKGWL